MATQPAPQADPNEAIYDALRKADAAGDADSVARLSLYLKQRPAPLADGHTMGFADEAPVEAQSTQLAPEQEKALVEYARQPDATPDGLRQLGAKMGRTITNADEVFKARPLAGVNDTIHYPLPKVEGGTTTGGAFAGGVGDSVSLGLAPRIAALAGATNDLAHGGEFDYTAHLDKARGVEATDNENHPYARIGGQLLGGLALPSGTEGVAFTAGRDALQGGASMAEARAIASAAARNRMAGVGAAYGGAYGFNSSYGDVGQRLASTATGALEGGAGGLAIGAAGEALAPRAAARAAALRAAPMGEAQRVAAAAHRLSDVLPGEETFDLLPADVGGAATRRLTSAAAQAPLSASPVIGAAQHSIDQGQSVRDILASRVGEALDPEAAGLNARQGAQRAIATTGNDVRAAFTAAERLGGDTRITPTGALDVLNRNIAELAQVPGGAPAVERLTGLRDALSRGTFTVAGIRNMRSVLRQEFIRDGLRGSDTERRVNQVLDAAQHDVTDGLTAAGRTDAGAAFAHADGLYRDRIALIDNVLTPLIGTRDSPKSGEQIIKTLTADLQGNNARAVRFLNALPPEEQANTRASIIGALGRQAPGAQNADGNGFSLSKFLTDWNKIGETAKRAYFGNESRAALNDLAAVAQGTKEAQGYANRSNSSGGIWGNLGVLAGGAVAAPVAAASGLAAQLVGGRLLASPRFARWLARAPRTSLGSAAYLDRLSRIARAEPAIANDVLGLQQRLSQILANGGSAPLAAQDKKDGAAVPPKQQGDDPAYQQWLQRYVIREDPTYDTRAAFQHGLKPDARGHLNDTYKLPTHPTFSDESIHNGEGGKAGGKWVDLGRGKWEFHASPWNVQNMSKPQLKSYFDKVEPGTTIIFPDGERYRGKEQ